MNIIQEITDVNLDRRMYNSVKYSQYDTVTYNENYLFLNNHHYSLKRSS